MKRDIINTGCSSGGIEGKVLLFVDISVDGKTGRALIDTGCEQSVISESFCQGIQRTARGPKRTICMLNGERTCSEGNVNLSIGVDDQVVSVWCLVARELVCDADMILGMDCIMQLGGIRIDRQRRFRFNVETRIVNAISSDSQSNNGVGGSVLHVEDTDFRDDFDGRRWVVSWKWKNEEPVLTNSCAEYGMDVESRCLFEAEIEQWIRDGWLEPYQYEVHGRIDGVIPLMAAKQPNKAKKIRPVLDYRELNESILSNPGNDVAVCQEKLRKWRMNGGKASLLDLKKAYLQIHISDDLKRFQPVKYKGKLYVMTRMGFGLSVAPKIMSKILSSIFSLNDRLREGCDHYIDDIWINEQVVSVAEVKSHLMKYGLVTKEPESLDNARVLGLRVETNDKKDMVWRRDAKIPEITEGMTKRGLFSLCGKLIGHYPVGGWLRPACSFIKRLSNEVGWDQAVPENVWLLAKEIWERVSSSDPVNGIWCVDGGRDCTVWCDASSLAMGIKVEIGGNIVEDATWLRRNDDGSHINVAELEAVLKGVSLALKWGKSNIKVMTDSVCVAGWLNSMLEDTGRPRVSGLSEMIIRRRLFTIKQLIDEFGITLTVGLVPSSKNVADEMTRVPKKWLNGDKCVNIGVVDDLYHTVMKLHDQHHLGVDRTVYLANKQLGVNVSRALVEKVVKACHRCRSIDPAPVRWNHGSLEVSDVWGKVATDVTHVDGTPYLTVIDCGPSRFCLWRKLRNETAEAAIEQLNHIFQERGAPARLLSDNGPCFKSTKMLQFLKGWGVKQDFSCAYRASTNGIIERNHRTIKRMVARSGKSVGDMVFWYNHSPNEQGRIPVEQVYTYETSLPGAHRLEGSEYVEDGRKLENVYHKGDRVYVKPVNAKCSSKWQVGRVTDIVSDCVVEVNGVNRHVADVRHANDNARDGCVIGDRDVNDEYVEIIGDLPRMGDLGDEEEVVGGEEAGEVQRNVVRERRPPRWFEDFYVG